MTEAEKSGKPATCEDWRLRDAQVEIEFLKAHIGDLYKQMLEAGLKISTKRNADQ